MKKILTLCLFCLSVAASYGQQNLVYNHYFINPFLYNPSYIAPSGYSELYLNYRKQWAGFEGAPQTATFNLQIPLNYKAGFAVTGYQDEAGLIKTTTGLMSFSYQVFLGRKITDLHKIGFGLSAGYTMSRIESEDSDDFTDPVLGNRNSSLDGQVGIHYQYNGFKLGFAIPRLFENTIGSEETFTHRGITQIRNTISSISFDAKLSHNVSIEPMVSYRTYETLDPQYEVLTSVKFSNIGWIGGAYRQNYGAVGFLGVNIKEKIKIGYAYEFATEQADRIGYGAHEFQLILRLGKKQYARPQITVKNAKPQQTHTVTKDPEEEEEEEDQEADESQDVAKDEASVVVQGNVVQNNDVKENTATQVPGTQPSTTQKTVVEAEPEQKETAKLPVTRLNGEGLAPGHYVVVGAFHSVTNAKNYAATLKRSGYPANVAYHRDRAYYIVHMLNAPTVEEARMQRDKYRQMSRYSFRDTWILSVE